MDSPQINIDKHIKHWTESSDDDFSTMIVLYNLKKYNNG